VRIELVNCASDLITQATGLMTMSTRGGHFSTSGEAATSASSKLKRRNGCDDKTSL
jgi:hypothetical protein